MLLRRRSDSKARQVGRFVQINGTLIFWAFYCSTAWSLPTKALRWLDWRSTRMISPFGPGEEGRKAMSLLRLIPASWRCLSLAELLVTGRDMKRSRGVGHTGFICGRILPRISCAVFLCRRTDYVASRIMLRVQIARYEACRCREQIVIFLHYLYVPQSLLRPAEISAMSLLFIISTMPLAALAAVTNVKRAPDCMVTEYAQLSDAVKSCSDLTLSGLSAPPSSTIDLQSLQTGATVTFAGRTVRQMGQELNDDLC